MDKFNVYKGYVENKKSQEKVKNVNNKQTHVAKRLQEETKQENKEDTMGR